MIKLKHKGDFFKTEAYLSKLSRKEYTKILDDYGREGVLLLSQATPVDTGKTANSWVYRIYTENDSIVLCWSNTNYVGNTNIAMILQYGHGTRNGGYVQGIDYINPAMKPLFDRLAEEAWKEVRRA